MAKKTRPRQDTDSQYLVSRSELARIFGVSLPTVDNWRRNGLPQIEVGGGQAKAGRRKYQFNVPDCIQWYLNRHVEDVKAEYLGEEDPDKEEGGSSSRSVNQKLNEARLRKANAQAEKAELENELRRGELVEAEDVRSVWAQHVLNVRNKILAVADAAAPRLAKMKRTQPIRDDLKKRLEHALEELSETDGSEGQDDDGGD